MPYAIAILKGNNLAPALKGIVELYPWYNGTIVRVEMFNLPPTKYSTNTNPPIGPFGFHIHEGTICELDCNNDFLEAKGHYNPTNAPHPFHAGDLPSLISNDGYSFMVVYTNRFKPEDVLNKAVIIHLHPDDYRTQPAGNSGDRIACGIIKKQQNIEN